MIKQCAWCKYLIIDGIRLDEKKYVISGMSHGICVVCKEKLNMQLNLFKEQQYAVSVKSK